MNIKTSHWNFKKDLKIFSQEYQPLTDPTGVITIVHGLGSHSSRYTHFAELFTRQGFTLLTFDLPGHGQSEGIRGHADSYSEIADVIQHFVDQSLLDYLGLPQYLFGHSLGGSLVLYYLITRTHNLTAAIASSPGLAPADSPGAVKIFAARLASRLLPALQIDNDLDISGLSRDPAIIQKYQTDPLVHPKISARLALELIENGEYILNRADRISIPLLVMQGTGDRLVDPEKTKQFATSPNPQITYKEWEGFYHELHNEPEKEAVLTYILEWIKGHPGNPLT